MTRKICTIAMAISLFNFFSLLCLAVTGVAAEQEECKPARCRHSGPEVRFPFWLKDRQPHYCGYPHPDFELSCSSSDTTQLEFQYPIRTSANNFVFLLQVKVEVLQIDYEFQRLYPDLYSADSCLPYRLLPAVNSSFASPSEIFDAYITNFNSKDNDISLFNCSSEDNQYFEYGRFTSCLSGNGYRIIALSSGTYIRFYNLASCTKIYNFSGVRITMDYLRWLKPSREDCEAQGKYCGSKDNSTQPRNGLSRSLIITVVIGILFLVLTIFIVSYRIIGLKKKKEDQKKIEKFLNDYKALRPTRFSYTNIKKITDNFKDKLGEGGYGIVYKGNLSNDILVAVKVLNNFKGNGEEFINEVGTIGTIHHKNVVRLVGYCADGYRRALLYEFLPNETLEKLILSRKRINSLGWEKLQQIAIDIGKGLDYLHQGCNQRILHFDIKPQNILLDHDFNPKVADFGLAKLCSKDQSVVSMTAARGTIGYIAPEVFSRNFGNVSYKSDVYSFGMLLLDMVGGRKRFQAVEGDSSQMYYPEWMYKQLEKGEEIEIQIDKEEDSRIFKKLSIVGLWCILWCPADRPSMKVAIQMLEGENMPAMPPNPFAAAKPTNPNAFTNGSCSPSNSEICSITETT